MLHCATCSDEPQVSILPLSLKVLQPWDVSQTSGTPRDSLLLQPLLPLVASCLPFQPALSAGSRDLLPGSPRAYRCSCAVSSCRQSNLGRGYNYFYWFLLYYPCSKILHLTSTWMFTHHHIMQVSRTSYHFTFCLRKHYQKYFL